MIVVREVVNLTLPPPRVPRSPGQHVSGIIRCLAGEAGILKPEYIEELSLVDYREITDPVAVLRIRIGLAWEEHYIPSIPDVCDHPEELQVDGVYMTPDGESVSVIITLRPNEDDEWVPTSIGKYAHYIHEVKATYKSINTVADLKGEWMWLAQIKSYCKARNTRFAMLHVLFICGDYKFPLRPQLILFRIEFTQQEIDDNWKLLTEYKVYREEIERTERGEQNSNVLL